MGRKQRSWNPNYEVMQMIASLYNELSDKCTYDRPKCYDGLSYQDMFQETILFISCDTKAVCLTKDKEKFIEYFIRRFKIVQFKVIHDSRRLKKEQYADYKQASPQEEERY